MKKEPSLKEINAAREAMQNEQIRRWRDYASDKAAYRGE